MKAKVDTSQAEKWLDDSHFLYIGKVYEVKPDGKVIESPAWDKPRKNK